MIGISNVTQMAVGKDLNILEGGLKSALATGQLGVWKNGSATSMAVGALAAGDQFVIAYKDVDGEIVNLPSIKYSNITSKSKAAYAAATQKKVFVGFNGTSGSIAINNSSLYLLNTILLSTTKAWAGQPPYERASYTSDATATELEIALGLLADATKNFTSAKPNKITAVLPGLICSTAVVAGNLLDHNATVVKGSDTIAVATNLTYAATVGTLALGDYLRIGTVGGGTVLTSEIYKITAINALNVTVDRPISNVSGTYATATADIEVIPAATVANAATHFGLSFTGQPLAFKPGLFKYEVIGFEIVLNPLAFSGTPTTVATANTFGTGTYEEISEFEWELNGNRGEKYRVASYPVARVLNATSGKTYNVVEVNYVNADTQSLDSNPKAYASILIGTEVSAGGNIYASLGTILGV